MKKVLLIIILVISNLSACNLTTPGVDIASVEKVPSHVEDKIDSSLELQLIEVSKNKYYVIYQKNGEIELGIDTKPDALILRLDIPNPQDNTQIQKAYLVTLDEGIDTNEVLVNGESKAFDNVTK